MSSATFEMGASASPEEGFQYRALHTGAVAGLVLAVFTSVMTIVASNVSPEACIWIGLLNAAALSLCLWSLAKIRRAPELYTGKPLAQVGTALSAVALVAGVAYGSYQYVTEVPEGYTRISFTGMAPDEIRARDGELVPPAIAALDGKRVFIRGYIRPDSVTMSRGIKQFLLVRDNNQCCFGDLSSVKYYDQILVDMVGSRHVDYHDGIFRLGGVLKIEPQNVAAGPTRPVFSMKADYAQY